MSMLGEYPVASWRLALYAAIALLNRRSQSFDERILYFLVSHSVSDVTVLRHTLTACTVMSAVSQYRAYHKLISSSFRQRLGPGRLIERQRCTVPRENLLNKDLCYCFRIVIPDRKCFFPFRKSVYACENVLMSTAGYWMRAGYIYIHSFHRCTGNHWLERTLPW